MFYPRSKLVESIQRDRHREARAEQSKALLGFQGRLRRHRLVVPLTVADTVTGRRSTMRHAVV